MDQKVLQEDLILHTLIQLVNKYGVNIQKSNLVRTKINYKPVEHFLPLNEDTLIIPGLKQVFVFITSERWGDSELTDFYETMDFHYNLEDGLRIKEIEKIVQEMDNKDGLFLTKFCMTVKSSITNNILNITIDTIPKECN